MDATIKNQLEKTACKVRMGKNQRTYKPKSGHPGGSLSIADLLTYLYFAKLNIDPKNPDMNDRDRFVLSKGHTAPALYSALAQRGFFPEEELKSLRHIGALLQGHPCIHIPGVDMSSGSLGQGISAACGMALSGKISSKDYKVYTVLGDGLQISLRHLAGTLLQWMLMILMILKELLMKLKRLAESLLQLFKRVLRAKAFHLWKIRFHGMVQHLIRNNMILQWQSLISV